MANKAAHAPDPVDVRAGETIRARRKMLGISQDSLANAIGVTFQQVQKYERGANRVSCSMLWRIARFLNAPIAEFFPEQTEDTIVAGLGDVGELAGTTGGFRLARNYLRLDGRQRQALLNVSDSLVDLVASEPGKSYVAGGDPESMPKHGRQGGSRANAA